MSDAELNGHIDTVEQCADYLDHETMDNGDPSGKLHDFICSIRAVVSALSSTREKYEQAVREVEELRERLRDEFVVGAEYQRQAAVAEKQLEAAVLMHETATNNAVNAKARAEHLKHERDSALRERDELRVEVEKLRASAENWDPDAYLERTEHLLTERDELRAEVDRLMGILGERMREGHAGPPAFVHPSNMPTIIDVLEDDLAAFRPREDEIDSVMSLLNWTRHNHDKDSSARLWLERVVSALTTTRGGK